MVSSRLRRRIDRDFPVAGSSDEVARLVDAAGDTERVQAAVVIWANGDLSRLRDAIDMVRADWRDALVRADLAADDWNDRLASELGPSA